MEFKGLVAELFISPTWRKLSVLLFLAAVLIIVVMWSFPSPARYDSPKIMICEKCGYRQQLRAEEKLKCPKCGKGMGYLWKCMTCRYEFEYLPSKKREAYDTEEAFRQAKIDSCRCPNCNSVETFPVTALNMPDKIPAPAN